MDTSPSSSPEWLGLGLLACAGLLGCSDPLPSVAADLGGPPSPQADAGHGRDLSDGEDMASPTDMAVDASVDVDAAGPATIGVFVATGAVGRRVVSFDDGHTWGVDLSGSSDEVCSSDQPVNLCFEGRHASRGGAFGDGFFYATYGWTREAGRANRVLRSADGSEWESVLEPGGFGGVAAGNGVVVLAGVSGSRTIHVSDDHGESWETVDNGLGTWVNIRSADFLPSAGGLFVLGGDGNGFEAHHAIVSEDGRAWRTPESIPAACPTNFRLYGGFGFIGDRVVMVGRDGANCYSDDSGRTWRRGETIGPEVRSQGLVSTGDGEILAWSTDRVHRTADGVEWTSDPLTPPGVSIGAVARNPRTGTFVAVTSGYRNGYASQQFYRSADGRAWELLEPDAFPQGHPIVELDFGTIPAP